MGEQIWWLDLAKVFVERLPSLVPAVLGSGLVVHLIKRWIRRKDAHEAAITDAFAEVLDAVARVEERGRAYCSSCVDGSPPVSTARALSRLENKALMTISRHERWTGEAFSTAARSVIYFWEEASQLAYAYSPSVDPSGDSLDERRERMNRSIPKQYRQRVAPGLKVSAPPKAPQKTKRLAQQQKRTEDDRGEAQAPARVANRS